MMNEQNESHPKGNNLVPQHTKCLVCKEDIIYGAKKCTKCESFQDWRRYFQFNVVVLSLLVALFSVVTISVPVIKSVVLPKADVKFSFLHFSNGNIMIVATNTGRRAAVLKNVSLNMEDKHNGSIRYVSLAVRDEAGKKEIVVTPDKWTVLALFPENTEDSFDLLDPADYRSCQLEFLTLDLNHKLKKVIIDVACNKAVR